MKRLIKTGMDSTRPQGRRSRDWSEVVVYFCFAAFFTCMTFYRLYSAWDGPLRAVRILPALLLPGLFIYMFVRIVATPRRRFQLFTRKESRSNDNVDPVDGPE